VVYNYAEVRILAIYYENGEEGEIKWLQIDVSREPGYWKLSRLLASAEIEEVRIVGESEASLSVARTLVVAGKFSRPFVVRERRLRGKGDEAYPRWNPFVFIKPVPDPSAFD
jgi:hypothetical protein